MIDEIIKGKKTWYRIVMLLGTYRNVICTRKINIELKMSTSNISTRLNSLERRKIIEYLMVKDKITKYWRLTEKGRAIYNTLIELEELMK